MSTQYTWYSGQDDLFSESKLRFTVAPCFALLSRGALDTLYTHLTNHLDYVSFMSFQILAIQGFTLQGDFALLGVSLITLSVH